MIDTKYTSGPWVLVEEDGDLHIKSADGESLMCDMKYYPWVPEKIEDLRLMAAAPELLEALIELRKWMGPCGLDYEIDAAMQAADKAIAKAKGDPS